MTERLTPDDFANLFGRFTTEAFRLEVQPVYLVDYEREAYSDFLRGEPRPGDQYQWFADWLAQISSATSQGRIIRRVRVMDEPPTDYQRFEQWLLPYNLAAGETIHSITRGAAKAAGIPITNDWWLFDSKRLAVMRFDPDGTPRGGHIVEDPETVAQHCVWRDLAVHHSALSPERATA